MSAIIYSKQISRPGSFRSARVTAWDTPGTGERKVNIMVYNHHEITEVGMALTTDMVAKLTEMLLDAVEAP